MKDPIRLLDGGGLPPELLLLRAASAEEPAPEGKRRLLAALGLSGALPAAAELAHHGMATDAGAAAPDGVAAPDAVPGPGMATDVGAAAPDGVAAPDAVPVQHGAAAPPYDAGSAQRALRDPADQAQAGVRPANDAARAADLASYDAARDLGSAAESGGGPPTALGLGAKLGAKLLLVVGGGLVLGWLPVAYFDLRPPLWGAGHEQPAASSGVDARGAPLPESERGVGPEPRSRPAEGAAPIGAEGEPAPGAGAVTPPSEVATPPPRAATSTDLQLEPSSRTAPSLAREVAQLDRVRGLLAAGRPWLALRAIDQYGRDFPAGVLRQESTLLRLEAMLHAKQPVRARELAAQFLREHPESPHRDRIRALLGEGHAR